MLPVTDMARASVGLDWRRSEILPGGVVGAAGDRYGRKWPMVINMLVLGLLQIATIYSTTFQQFLAVRSLFGLFMGGVYGNAIAMALENAPVEV